MNERITQALRDKLKTFANKQGLTEEELCDKINSEISSIEEHVTGKSKYIECDKKQALAFYEHLLDLVERERMSKNFSEWCELEREYIALIGEEHFTEYFKNKE